MAVLSAVILAGSGARSQAGDELPRVFLLQARSLSQAKAAVGAHDPGVMPSFALLRAQADAALQVQPSSVMNKTLVPPSGDKHDYMSLGAYWWPDPTKPDGLPYIHRDGQVNPRNMEQSDRPAMEKMSQAVETLALCYYFSEEEKYAAHAAKLLKTWFLDPETKMNPHLEYAAGVPGSSTGRHFGIIDTVFLVPIVDSIGLLQGSKSWTAEDQKLMVDWFSAYLTWLLESDFGKAEKNFPNNHGTWFDVQAASYALFTGRNEEAAKIIESARKTRLDRQITEDGRQPEELARSRSLTYSIFNLEALLKLAALGQHVGVDLYHYGPKKGPWIRAAIDMLAPYVNQNKPWPYTDIRHTSRTKLLPILRRAAIVYDDTRYEELIRNHASGEEIAQRRIQLLDLNQPVKQPAGM